MICMISIWKKILRSIENISLNETVLVFHGGVKITKKNKFFDVETSIIIELRKLWK